MAIDRGLLRAQALAMRAAMDPARGGLPAKVLAFECGIPEATLRSWAKDEPAAMPLGALWQLAGVVPIDLLNLMLPDGLALVRVPDGQDHAACAAAAMDFAAGYAEARHPESEAGCEIGPGEDAELNARAARLRGVN